MGVVGYAFAMWWHEWTPILGFFIVLGISLLRTLYWRGVIVGERK